MMIVIIHKYMKGKQNRKHKPSQNRSASYDRSMRKSINSHICESSRSSVVVDRDSLCSPRQKENKTNKFDTYMQYISSGRFPQEANNHKNQPYFNRPKTAVPRRMSICIMEQGRRSVLSKENPSKDYLKHEKASRAGSKTPRQKNKPPLFVKGNNIIKGNKSRQDIKKRNIHDKTQTLPQKRKSTIKIQDKKHQKNEEKTEEREKKLIQKLFAGIQFHRELGRGAHAVVKSGVDFNKQKKIAIKIYEKRQLTSQNMKSIERQVQILGIIDHPSIIKLYEIIETIKTINLVMEYGGGNSLQQYIRNKLCGRLEEDEAKIIFRAIVSAVAYLHKRGIAHRDIKTDNILLNKYLQVKLIDFGYSYKRRKESTIETEMSTTYCGTPTYMAPEIVAKKPHCPWKADIWALGILLYNMFHGHCPFKTHNQKQLFKKILEGNITFQVQISEAAQNLILRLLDPRPQQRPDPEMILKHEWLASQ